MTKRKKKRHGLVIPSGGSPTDSSTVFLSFSCRGVSLSQKTQSKNPLLPSSSSNTHTKASSNNWRRDFHFFYFFKKIKKTTAAPNNSTWVVLSFVDVSIIFCFVFLCMFFCCFVFNFWWLYNSRRIYFVGIWYIFEMECRRRRRFPLWKWKCFRRQKRRKTWKSSSCCCCCLFLLAFFCWDGITISFFWYAETRRRKTKLNLNLNIKYIVVVGRRQRRGGISVRQSFRLETSSLVRELFATWRTSERTWDKRISLVL